MTTIGRPVSRETAATERGVPIVVELHPRHLLLRLKGQRAAQSVYLDYGAARDLALKLKARRNGVRV